MTVVNEIPRVHRWLRTVLAADATLAGLATGGIYRGFAPKRPAGSATYPIVIYQFLAALDDNRGASATTQNRIWMRARYIVKAVHQTNDDAAVQTLADRIEAVLEAAHGGASDIGIDSCVRVKPVYYIEQPVAQETRETFVHMGGEYEIAARYAG